VPFGFWLLTREMPLRLGWYLRPALEFGCATVILTGLIVLVARECQLHELPAIGTAGVTLAAACLLAGFLFVCFPAGRLAMSEARLVWRSTSMLKGCG